MKQLPALVLLLISLICCESKEVSTDFRSAFNDSPSIEGNTSYLNSPYVTAGNRVYMVGHQDGSFPELGWHIKGEMGGIWNHPIKIMDGFNASLVIEDEEIPLDAANSFINYPIGNKHLYKLSDQNLNIERLQFVPDNKEGIAVQFVLENNRENPLELEFRFTGHSDLRPTWLGEESGMKDGQDEGSYDQSLDAWIIKDASSPWSVIFGADSPSISQSSESSDYSGNGISRQLSYAVAIPAQGTAQLTFTIAGSYNNTEAAIESFEAIKTKLQGFVQSKKERYASLANQSKLTIPDKKMQEAFEWLKYNCDWLIRTVPEIGTGITAGIPDYPWWFGVDSEYALKGYMAIGQTDAVNSTIALLDSVSNAVNGNGKIIHEMSTNGVVFNKGNINETPQFASLIWEIYQWNGELEFLQKYFPTVKKGLEWLMAENDENKNLFPDGFGMMEIHGLDSEMIDVAAYTQRAFDDASKMALALGDTELSKQYSDTAKVLKEQINKAFWSEEFNSYADFLGTDKQALHLIEDAIVRADTLDKPWAIEELKQTKNKILANPSKDLRPFVLHHNWVVNTPMEMKIAEEDKALRALETAEKFVNPFGVFVTGIDRDASAGSDDGSFAGSKVFSYTGAVMTLPTGVQAVAENNYGRPDKALNYLERMTRTFSYALPGSIYEVSPDYGMITQAWNIYSYAVPIVNQFFGIQPRASEKKVVIAPQMPKAWKNASLEHVMIADNEVSVFYEDGKDGLNIQITQQNPEWTLEVILPEPENGEYHLVKGEAKQSKSGTDNLFTSSSVGLEIQLQLSPSEN
ncbi:MAG: glycogen debranching protein [Flavobacteriaceae bacterium]